MSVGAGARPQRRWSREFVELRKGATLWACRSSHVLARSGINLDLVGIKTVSGVTMRPIGNIKVVTLQACVAEQAVHGQWT